MRRKLILLLTIVEILSLIGPIFSGTFVDLEEKSQFSVYNRLRDKNVHRGVLLSLSAVQKNEWCQDAFSAQLYVVSDTEMGTTSIRRLVRDTSRISVELDEPQHPLIVRKLVFQRISEIRNDLTFRCVGHFTKRSPPGESYFYVSSAYQPKWLYSDFNMHEKDEEKLTLLNYILLSPDFVENNQLEKRFLNVLRTINALREESSEYVADIEKRDILTILSDKQKQILCASVISSPVYRKDRLEFIVTWLGESQNSADFRIEKKFMSFKNPDNTVGKLPVNCYLCKAIENEGKSNSKTRNLYLTSSYDDGFSIIVLKENEDGIFIDKYFKNIALIIAARENMNYHHLFLNYK